MISFYNYLNFYYFNKKFFLNLILNVWFTKNFKTFKNLIIFSVLKKSNKIDIKNSVEFFLELRVLKINTLICKKRDKKKAFIYYNGFI
ncbi:50S ribosomal protein L23 [Candidatus Nasuia deltocephalinicola]|uniref:50S ribosomal protein L23 n=1 Tax=Candidatus Nasuia deltocephalincola TaxID=1160784 RepID=UPI00216AEA90|nr:50S ribosomal protein L23 [Candidatus Nasuia deltocephalinicola]